MLFILPVHKYIIDGRRRLFLRQILLPHSVIECTRIAPRAFDKIEISA
jgi:hypothetical protein